LRIVFLLSSGAKKPVGGCKVVYEYANKLVDYGHEVCVVHPAFLPNVQQGPILHAAGTLSRYLIRGAFRQWRPDDWFTVDPRVQLRWVPSLRPQSAPDADAVIATWWRTAEILDTWPAQKGRKYYLIQHLETWGGPEDRVMRTWRLPLAKIVIAKWLAEIARELNESCYYIPNGLDFTAFGIDISPEGRDAGSVAMLYHEQEWKGSKDGIRALEIARSRFPNLRAELFGVYRRPKSLPAWIRYHQNPSQIELRAIYNRAAIFLGPSWSEGWGLTPPEAMMCGCAVVCTDIGGHREYAVDGQTALLRPVRDAEALADGVIRLIEDGALRRRLAEAGNAFIQQFTWQRAARSLEAVLMGSVGPDVREST
jgi:glycosyltransferase involved in cell wall biosynthesis